MHIRIEIPDEVGQYLRDNPRAGRLAIAKRFGVGDRQSRIYAGVARMIKAAENTDAIDFEDFNQCNVEEKLTPNESGLITITGRCLKEQYSKESVIQKAIDEAGIDYKNWRIKDIETSKWPTSMKLRKRVGEKSYQFIDEPIQLINWKVGIKLVPNENRHVLTAFELIVEQAIPLASLPAPKLPKKQDLLGLIEPADAHISKYAWHQETLAGDMDVPIAVRHFEEAVSSCLWKMSRDGVCKIVLVVGHDLTHIDNMMGETPRGKHHLDFDTRFPYIMAETEKALIRTCDRILQIAPLEIIWVPGNHDYHASYMICRLLAQRYRNCKHVNVDMGPSPRKMVLWGQNLIGLCHDAEGRKRAPTVNLLAQHDPWKLHWSNARWTELHTGHLHKREVMTVGGTIWRRIPALSTVDMWHVEGVFTDAIPACDSFVYHKQDGLFAEYIKNIDYLN